MNLAEEWFQKYQELDKETEFRISELTIERDKLQVENEKLKEDRNCLIVTVDNLKDDKIKLLEIKLKLEEEIKELEEQRDTRDWRE